jgi:hypothetical protein
MSETFHHASVKRSRKERRCDWCAEKIEVGQPNESYCWADGGDCHSVYMHPECYEAMRQACRLDPNIVWSPGDFVRGSTMEMWEFIHHHASGEQA